MRKDSFMRITLKLFAILGDHLPSEVEGQRRAGNELTVDVPDGTCVQEVIDRFNLPSRLVHLVLVNGVYISPRACAGHVLNADDEVAIWPPIGGG
jgi:sulfur carrier protein ThiS